MLFGDIAPAGKLPITFPKSLAQLPAFEDYSMTGRTYRYMTEEPLYPFGFGLSYTTFAYRDLRITLPSVPLSQLIGFQRVHLELGQSQTVTITVKPEMLMLIDEDGQHVFQPGTFRLMAGSCSPGSRGTALGAAEPATIEIISP